MSIDQFIASLSRPDWLATRPLASIIPQYVESMQRQRYCEFTIRHYLSALAHFNHWAVSRPLTVSNIGETAIREFIGMHLPTCGCPNPCFRGHLEIAAALRRLLMLLDQLGERESSRSASTPVSTELLGFRHYLVDMCGLAMSTCSYRLRVVRLFLDAHFGGDPIDLSLLSPQRVDDWIIGLAQRYRPSSLGVIRASLQSYFRYRALCGDSTSALSAALPVLPRYDEAKLIKTMTGAELERFLRSFDLTQSTGLRDFAMARCLSDLGLRGQEVTQLALDDIDWRAGTLTLRKTKGQRVRVLPLPVSTGSAIAGYLRKGRPKTCSRRLFVRHVAPFDEPLGRHAAANAMNRAYIRSGLGGQFSGTHVLRRTLATRLQRGGSSLKAIADLLGHRELRTTTRYAKIDFERLRRIALPWAGRQL
jgi:site-specific recombinase XerD